MAASLYSRVKSAYELHEKEGWYSHTVSYMSPPEDYFSDKRACVLACIREEENGELSLLLTVRSAKVSSFQGTSNHLTYAQPLDLLLIFL